MRFIAFFEVRPEELDTFIDKVKGYGGKGYNVKIISPPHVLAEPFNDSTGFVVFESDDYNEIMKYLLKYKIAGAKVRLQLTWKDMELAKELVRFNKGKQKVEQQWQTTTFDCIKEWGSTRSLEILPLVDWNTNREELQVETGVSYLIKTDEAGILFDLGLNRENRDPSPLLHNMKQLGITLDAFNIIVISHNHADHIGGRKWLKNKTFSLTAHQIDLGSKRVYTPIPMIYPGLHPIWVENPTIIAQGVATIGTILNHLFMMGSTLEQALAVNVKEKGVVLIVGCGHQTLPKIIERTEALFEEPIYGVFGGLHYSASGGPIEIMGMSPHKHMGTGKVPWQPITMNEVHENINHLKTINPKVVGLSAHDSSKASIEAFRKAFPTAYKDIRVGERIIIS